MKPFLNCSLLLFLVLTSASTTHSSSTKLDLTSAMLKSELYANWKLLRNQEDPKPYYMSLKLHDSLQYNIQTSLGKLHTSAESHFLSLESEVRVGSPEFDNTQPTDAGNTSYPSRIMGGFSPNISNKLLKRKIKSLTESAWRGARTEYLAKKNNTEMRSEKFAGSDFSFVEESASIANINVKRTPFENTPSKKDTSRIEQEKALTALSLLFKDSEHMHNSMVNLSLTHTKRSFHNTRNTHKKTNDLIIRLSSQLFFRSKDGMPLHIFRSWTFEKWPTAKTLLNYTDSLKQLSNDFEKLVQAPVGKPYTGPVLLKAPAAAVLLHEIYGHRVESHRFRMPGDGHTFLHRQGKELFPNWINVNDKPLLENFQNTPLMGRYTLDNEGVNAQNVNLIEKGVIKGFLSGRELYSDTSKSNGHGRAQGGLKPVARMGNLILEVDSSYNQINEIQLSDSLLRQKLIEEAKKAGLEYGLIIHDLAGGFTLTQRDLPQSFKLHPYWVSQVFVDGRPDQVLRGLDISGTPVETLGSILAAGKQSAVFNGFCGAESGYVPVSAIAPPLLIQTLSAELAPTQHILPPFLIAPHLVKGEFKNLYKAKY
ncbi:metallopeptidase TldD-related protein [Fibrobacterales bacterium]|nr:metallopeptidase TldD-related protein [Fibrobacterales bacterium]